MAIDDSRHHVHSVAVNHLRILRRFDGLAHFCDFSVFNQHGAMFDRAVRDREHRGVLNKNYGRCVWWSRSVCRREVKEVNEAQEVKESEELCAFVCAGLACGFHWIPPRTVVDVFSCCGVLVPVKSMLKSWTAILPFNVFPSNVPVNTTSVGALSRRILMVKVNLSALR